MNLSVKYLFLPLFVFFLINVNKTIARECSSFNYFILQENLPLREQMTYENTIYEIRYNFDLNNETLKIPLNATLKFVGGKIYNGNIIFNETNIISPSFNDVRFKGSVYNSLFDITHYGAKSKEDMDCSIVINDLINLSTVSSSTRSSKTIYIPNGVFYIDNPIVLFVGWEAPITLVGNGITSTLCQRDSNNYIIKIYENHYVRNLNLTYKVRQGIDDKKSIAVACQRAIFCSFENLTISKANTAFGYITKIDAEKDNLTKLNQQVYVSCNFKNIRIYEYSSYAFDLKKEIDGGDSGSVYDNIYINTRDCFGSKRDNVAKGAIRGQNSVLCFTQLNIEGDNYTEPLIELYGMSRISCQSLHVEGLKNIPSIIKTTIQSVVSIDILDIQNCRFENENYRAFGISNNGKITINHLLLRGDCIKNSVQHKGILVNEAFSHSLKINYLFDPITFFIKDEYDEKVL